MAEELGDLPLALAQAAAYIEAAATTIKRYLRLFRERRAELWAHEKPPPGYQKTVAETFSLALEVARGAKALGVTVILDPGPVRPLPDGFLSLCDIITPNETEAQALVGFPVTGPESAARAAAALLERGAGTVVVKLGAQGAYFASQDGCGMVLPFQVDAVDSVAAGDAFNGALAVSLAEGQVLQESVTVASAPGALAVTRTGAQPSMPMRQQVEAPKQSQRS